MQCILIVNLFLKLPARSQRTADVGNLNEGFFGLVQRTCGRGEAIKVVCRVRFRFLAHEVSPYNHYILDPAMARGTAWTSCLKAVRVIVQLKEKGEIARCGR